MPPKKPKGPKATKRSIPPKGKPQVPPTEVSPEVTPSPGLAPEIISQLRRAVREDAKDPVDILVTSLAKQVVYFVNEQGVSPLEALIALNNAQAELLNLLAEYRGEDD